MREYNIFVIGERLKAGMAVEEPVEPKVMHLAYPAEWADLHWTNDKRVTMALLWPVNLGIL